MCIMNAIIKLKPLEDNDREQFIRDNQEAFLYGAVKEYGLRDVFFEEDGQIISRQTIEESIDAANAEAYRIVLGDIKLGGLVIRLDDDRGCLDLLMFVSSRAQDCSIGYAAWQAVEQLHQDVRNWEIVSPCFEKRNILFYVNQCGLHIVEFFDSVHSAPHNKDSATTGQDGDGDGLLRFEKVMWLSR